MEDKKIEQEYRIYGFLTRKSHGYEWSIRVYANETEEILREMQVFDDEMSKTYTKKRFDAMKKKGCIEDKE